MSAVKQMARDWPSLVDVLHRFSSVACVVVLLLAATECRRESPRRHGAEEVPTARAGLVEILRGVRPEAATRVCWGVVAACWQTRSVIVTAAHCVAPPARLRVGELYVKYDNRVDVATNARVHPRFNVANRSVNFDIATVEAGPCLSEHDAVPIASATASPGETRSVTTWVQSKTDGAEAWRSIAVAEATATALTLEDNAPICLGSSGAPVLALDQEGQPLVGVVSSGPVDCARKVQVARTSAAYKGFLEQTLRGQPPVDAQRTCGECLEQAWEGNASCVASVTSCRSERACAERLACFAADTPGGCSESASASKSSEDLFVRVRRCLCLVACPHECANACNRYR